MWNMLSWIFWIPFVIKEAIQNWTKCACCRSSTHPGHQVGSLSSLCYGWVMMATWGRPVLLVWKPQAWSPQPLSSVTLPWQCEFYLWIQSRELISKYKFPSVKLKVGRGFLQGVERGTAYKEAKSVKKSKCTSDLKDKA